MPVTGDKGFPCSSVSTESACNARDLGSIPGSGRSPGEGNGNPLQYSCLENPMNREAWQSRTLRSDFSLHFTHVSQRPGPESEPHSSPTWAGRIRPPPIYPRSWAASGSIASGPRRGRATNLPNPPLKSGNLNHRRSVPNGQALPRGEFPGQGAGLPEVAGSRLLFVVWAADGKEKPKLRRRCGAAVTTGARAAARSGRAVSQEYRLWRGGARRPLSWFHHVAGLYWDSPSGHWRGKCRAWGRVGAVNLDDLPLPLSPDFASEVRALSLPDRTPLPKLRPLPSQPRHPPRLGASGPRNLEATPRRSSWKFPPTCSYLTVLCSS